METLGASRVKIKGRINAKDSIMSFFTYFFSGSAHGRSLGMRRTAHKLCLYDPYEEGALVLYAPPDVIEHEKMTSKR